MKQQIPGLTAINDWRRRRQLLFYVIVKRSEFGTCGNRTRSEVVQITTPTALVLAVTCYRHWLHFRMTIMRFMRRRTSLE